MNAFRSPRLFGCCILLALLPAHYQAPAAAPPQPPPLPAEKVQQAIFRLKYVKASEASRILRDLFGRPMGGRAAFSIAVDEGSNSLILAAGPRKLAEVEAILSKIDTERPGKEGGRPELRTYHLGRLEPDEALLDALRLLFLDRGKGKFVLDRGRRLVIVYADEPTLDRVKVLLRGLEIQAENTGELPPRDVQVRLFWLVGGQLPKNVPGLPDDLKELATELGKGGLDKPRLGAQLAITTALEGKFESAGTIGLGASYELTVSGTTAMKKDRVGVQLTVSVSQAAQRRTPSRRVASLRTQVTVLPGRPTVLVVTPSGALVLQVEGRKPQPPAKRFSFEMRDKPWKDVFTWLTENSGKPIVRLHTPVGSFTFIGPRNKTYSISEVIDIINEGLMANSMTQKYCLIHRERSFTLVPADEKIDPALLPRIDVGDLDKRGRTEIVSVLLPLRSLSAEDVAAEVKKMLGPFGDVVAIKKSNHLLVQDSVGNLRRIYQTIQGIEKPKGK